MASVPSPSPPPPPAATITITELSPSPDNDLYDVVFQDHQIKTTVTSDPTVVTDWISAAKSSSSSGPGPLLVGLDVEWRPSFNRNIENPVATLQLCVGPACLVFQLLYSSPPFPKSLSDFLANEGHTFVGVGIGSDVEKLVGDHELTVRKTVDLGNLAAEKAGVRTGAGLKELARVVMGVEVEKPKNVTMSRWDAEWLSYQQIQYACVDAFLSFEIGRRLMATSPTTSH